MKLFLFLVACLSSASGFGAFTRRTSIKRAPATSVAMASSVQEQYLDDPKQRDAHYGTQPSMNTAQYLIDLHDSKATFNFCGGMMFQLVLTDKLRDHLVKVAESSDHKDRDGVAAKHLSQPVIYDSSKRRMESISDYTRTGNADNVHTFHGREIRKVTNAAGGMGFVLQLSYADEARSDPEGWTSDEVNLYDGWKHDVSRTWRNGDRLEMEGVKNFKETFGNAAFTLNHRFYLHFDGGNRMWLSAEDGCEGTPAVQSGGMKQFLSSFFP